MVSGITLDPYSIEKSTVMTSLAMVILATPERLTELGRILSLGGHVTVVGYGFWKITSKTGG